MADWTAEVFENEYLAADATDVHAIVIDRRAAAPGPPVSRAPRPR